MTKHALLSTLVGVAAAIAACGDPQDSSPLESADPTVLTWLAPRTNESLAVGDVVALTVATQNPGARAVHFEIDGREIGVCDPAGPDADCRSGDFWQWAATLDTPGHHVLAATMDLDAGPPMRVTRELNVASELPVDDDGDGNPSEIDPVDPSDLVWDGDGTIVESDTGELLDPATEFHNVFQSRIWWRVQGGRVVLERGSINGETYRVRDCARRIGPNIARYADLNHVSRASVIGAAMASSWCGAVGPALFRMPAPSVFCAAITGRSTASCRRELSSTDFAVDMAVRWIHQLRRVHFRDPPKIAAAFGIGAVVRSSSSWWRMAALRDYGGSDFITRFVGAYNTYRSIKTIESTVAALTPVNARPDRGDRVLIDVPRTGMVVYHLEVAPGVQCDATFTGSARSFGRGYLFYQGDRPFPGDFMDPFGPGDGPMPLTYGSTKVNIAVRAGARVDGNVQLLVTCH